MKKVVLPNPEEKALKKFFLGECLLITCIILISITSGFLCVNQDQSIFFSSEINLNTGELKKILSDLSQCMARSVSGELEFYPATGEKREKSQGWIVVSDFGKWLSQKQISECNKELNNLRSFIRANPRVSFQLLFSKACFLEPCLDGFRYSYWLSHFYSDFPIERLENDIKVALVYGNSSEKERVLELLSQNNHELTLKLVTFAIKNNDSYNILKSALEIFEKKAPQRVLEKLRSLKTFEEKIAYISETYK